MTTPQEKQNRTDEFAAQPTLADVLEALKVQGEALTALAQKVETAGAGESIVASPSGEDSPDPAPAQQPGESEQIAELRAELVAMKQAKADADFAEAARAIMGKHPIQPGADADVLRRARDAGMRLNSDGTVADANGLKMADFLNGLRRKTAPYLFQQPTGVGPGGERQTPERVLHNPTDEEWAANLEDIANGVVAVETDA